MIKGKASIGSKKEDELKAQGLEGVGLGRGKAARRGRGGEGRKQGGKK